MTSDTLLYGLDGHTATITLNRPQAMNAFDDNMREMLLARIIEAEADAQVRCIVITGVGKAFCAGGDIASMKKLQADEDTTVLKERLRVAGELVRRFRAIPKPIIAAVNGAAAGAGMNLALACDIRYAAASASFAETFVKIGLVPDWAGHHLLPRLIGTARALELIMSGERIPADEAQRMGLVNHVFPDDKFRSLVEQRVSALARGPSGALAAIKHGVYLGASGTLDETLAFETKAQLRLFLSTDAKEGMRAFLEKRSPRFGSAESE